MGKAVILIDQLALELPNARALSVQVLAAGKRVRIHKHVNTYLKKAEGLETSGGY